MVVISGDTASQHNIAVMNKLQGQLPPEFHQSI